MIFILLFVVCKYFFSKRRQRHMRLKWLGVYRKEYRESWFATIEKADASYERDLCGWWLGPGVSRDFTFRGALC